MPFGSLFAPEEHAFVLKNGSLVSSEKGYVKAGSIEPGYAHLKISRQDLAEFMAMGLPEWHEILLKEDRNDFEQAALTSVTLHTRSATKAELSDRILTVFAGLESLLLKNNTEPLTQNIADRLALATGTSVEQRLRIVQTVRTTYEARSRFVHHGEAPDDVLSLSRFLEIVWEFYIVYLPPTLKQFTTKKDFVEALDRKNIPE